MGNCLCALVKTKSALACGFSGFWIPHSRRRTGPGTCAILIVHQVPEKSKDKCLTSFVHLVICWANLFVFVFVVVVENGSGTYVRRPRPWPSLWPSPRPSGPHTCRACVHSCIPSVSQLVSQSVSQLVINSLARPCNAFLCGMCSRWIIQIFLNLSEKGAYVVCSCLEIFTVLLFYYLQILFNCPETFRIQIAWQ